MAKGDELQERLVDFAVGIIGLCSKFPKTQAARHLAAQLLRSGTSPAPNYAEARGAESLADFVHKLRIALKELNESLIWLRIAKKSALLPPEQTEQISKECGELACILGASIKTARK